MAQSLTKTIANFSTSLASLANNTSVIGGPWSSGGTGAALSAVFSAAVIVRIGYTNASAPTAPVQCLVQGLAASSGNADWVTIASFMGAQLALTTNTLAASGNGSSTTALTATGTSTLTDFGRVFIYNSGTPANSEFNRTARAVTASTTINIVSGLVNSQNSSVIYQPVEEFVTQIDMGTWSNLRVNIYNPSGNTVYWNSEVNTTDSIG